MRVGIDDIKTKLSKIENLSEAQLQGLSDICPLIAEVETDAEIKMLLNEIMAEIEKGNSHGVLKTLITLLGVAGSSASAASLIMQLRELFKAV